MVVKDFKIKQKTSNGYDVLHPETRAEQVIINQTTGATLDQHLDESKYKVASGTATAIILSIANLTEGYSTTFIASASNNGATTTINGKPLYKPNTTTTPKLVTGKAYTVWYNQSSDRFFIKASAEGDVLAANVLAGKIFSNDDDTGIIGAMTNRGAVKQSLTTQNQEYTIPQGYHSGSGKVTATMANLTAPNIKKGINVGGVVGTLAEGVLYREVIIPDYSVVYYPHPWSSSNVVGGYVAETLAVIMSGRVTNFFGNAISLSSVTRKVSDGTAQMPHPNFSCKLTNPNIELQSASGNTFDVTLVKMP